MRRLPLVILLKRSRINPVSKKRRKAIPERQRLRAEQLSQSPWCEACLDGCKLTASDVHEVINRSQRSTSWLESQFFVSLCRNCHAWVTTHPIWSRHHGYTLSAYQSEQEWLDRAERARKLCRDQTCMIDHVNDQA